MDVTEAMGDHIRGRVDKLPRLDDQIRSVTVTLASDSGTEQAEVVAKCHKNTLVANARSHDMYMSIDEAFEKLEKQVARLHDKLMDRRAREAQKASEHYREPR